ncbi:hypothetical protein D3C71_1088040 [compost metagenome]
MRIQRTTDSLRTVPDPTPLNTKPRTQIPRKRIRCNDDAAFDQHLIHRTIDHLDQLAHLRDLLRDVADHQRIGAFVGNQHAARRQETVLLLVIATTATAATSAAVVVADPLGFRQRFEDRFSVVIVDLHVIGDQILAVLDRDTRVFLVLLELGQLRLRCHPDHATIATLVQALGPQHDVHGLIPRHVDQAQRHIALHRVRGHHVEVGLLGNQLQNGTHRHVLEVEGHGATAVAACGHRRSGLCHGLGGDRTGRQFRLTRRDLDHVLVAGLVGQRIKQAGRAQHQLCALARGLGVDALHRGGEIHHVERALQLGGQRGIAHVHHHAVALVAQVRACALTIELQDQTARAVLSPLEVDLGY